MNRSTRLFLLLFVTVGLAFASFQPLAVQAQESVKISLLSRTANQPVLDVLSKAYNESHKNQIEVTLIPNDQFVTKFATAMASGAGPDIISIDLIYVPAFAAAGQMTDISDLA